jgi:hypothetical protein
VSLIDSAHALVDQHLTGPILELEAIQHVEYEPALRRWYVRFGCDAREATTIYFDLHQRTLRHEVFFLPGPEDPQRRAALAEWLLQRNHDLYGTRFSMGAEGDVYLTGRVALEHLTAEEIDRIIGVIYEITERWFQAAVRIAYARRA